MARLVQVLALPPASVADRRRKPEGSFAPFIMDFSVVGGVETWPTRDHRNRHNKTFLETEPCRYALGSARSYTVDGLNLPPPRDRLLEKLRSRKPPRLATLLDPADAEHKPELGLLTGNSRTVTLHFYRAVALSDDPPLGSGPIIPVQEVSVRIPVAISIKDHFLPWLESIPRSTVVEFIKFRGGRPLYLRDGGTALPLIRD